MKDNTLSISIEKQVDVEVEETFKVFCRCESPLTAEIDYGKRSGVAATITVDSCPACNAAIKIQSVEDQMKFELLRDNFARLTLGDIERLVS